MYIHDILIENIRCFPSATLQLNYPGRENAPEQDNINLLLGDNGTGKTTILRALALCAMAPAMRQSGYRPYRFVRRPAGIKAPEKGKIRAMPIFHEGARGKNSDYPWLSDGIRIEIVRRENADRDFFSYDNVDIVTRPKSFENSSNPFLVVGYGASRGAEHPDSSFDRRTRQEESETVRYQSVAGLFDNNVDLTPLSSWLPNLESKDKKRFREVVELIDRLLPESSFFTGKLGEKGEFLFDINGVDMPFNALSDGYRAYIGWITDLIYHLSSHAPNRKTKLTDVRGLVLVDEIDLHLHPAWQRSVISSLSSHFKNLQFVLTTHSPLVAGSFHKESIFFLEIDRDGDSYVRRPHERIYGLDADQLLLSPYFGLRTTRSESFVDELRDLSIQAGLGDTNAAFKFIEKLKDAAETPIKRTAQRERSKPDKEILRKLGFDPWRTVYFKFRKIVRLPLLGAANIILITLLAIYIFYVPGVKDFLLSTAIMTAGLILCGTLFTIQVLALLFQFVLEQKISKTEAKYRKKL